MSEWQIIFNQGLNSYIKLINDYVAILDDSKIIPIKDSIKKLSFKIPSGLKKSEYQLKGKFPVIDQGKVSEGGFSDDERLLIKNDLPLIIFGDHTRAIKYVDCNFIIGADGVKLLKPKDIFVEKYYYYLLNGLNIGNRGYGRHFKILNSKQVFIPYFSDKDKSLKFQKNVVNFLDDLEKNALKEISYFNTKIEKEILKLHYKQLETLKLFKLNTDQDNYLASLRQQILQDAISGKLTADWRTENPDIEPASKLLEKIKTEKENLILEKKIKKEKPLLKIAEDEVPFDLPKKWEWCRFGEVVNYRLGKTPPSKDTRYWKNGEYKWVSISDMTEYGIVKDTQRKVTQLALDKVFKHPPIPKGTLLMSFKLTIGRTSILGTDSYHNEAIISIYPYHTEYKKFLFYFLPIFSQWGNKRKAIKGNTLNSKKLNNLTIPLPPLAEQKAIVVKVEKLMKHVSALEEKIKQNKQDAETLMQSFLVKFFK